MGVFLSPLSLRPENSCLFRYGVGEDTRNSETGADRYLTNQYENENSVVIIYTIILYSSGQRGTLTVLLLGNPFLFFFFCEICV